MKQCTSVKFSGHALRRMFDRKLSTEEVIFTIQTGETIKGYPDDKPYPSELRLGWVNGKPVHVVVAQNQGNNECYVITAYVPSPEIWSDDFKIRRS
ncbi:hypothetical protein DOQ08_00130 [Marinobacter litoralis]|uniref:DUF4258 domain-containing protein n=1 Tax=Marinobacter litoralis TaxID=187981 RepID=A0A3M2RJF7_9GAMM|nr:hypothetical protein DOQ08_00130 [Marinobacter litoralis]